VLFVIRRSLQETEEFLQRKHKPNISQIYHSMLENWKLVIAGMMLVSMTTVSFYLITVYTPTFGKNVLKLSTESSLIVTFCIGIPISSGCRSWGHYRTASAAGHCCCASPS